MTVIINRADVPTVSVQDMLQPLQWLVSEGKGLALFNGLSEHDIRRLEDALWQEFSGSDESRVAVALRLRALLAVFSARRLRDMILQRGFKSMRAAFATAASERLNARFGFNPQRFLMLLDEATVPRAARTRTSVLARAA